MYRFSIYPTAKMLKYVSVCGVQYFVHTTSNRLDLDLVIATSLFGYCCKF